MKRKRITNTWILIANSTHATVYEKTSDKYGLRKVETFNFPEGRFKSNELVSDRPGRVAQQSCHRTKGLGPEHDAHEHAVDRFVRVLSQYLEQGRKSEKFQGLVLMAPPKFLGKLQKSISHETAKKISRAISKNFNFFSKSEILAAI